LRRFCGRRIARQLFFEGIQHFDFDGRVDRVAWGPARLTPAITPRASPALRTIGCMMEASYCTQSYHEADHIFEADRR
jgi:hypothetical protein